MVYFYIPIMTVVALKARAELNCDVFKVISILGVEPWCDYLDSFSVKWSSPATLIIKFAASENDLPAFFRSMDSFFRALLTLTNCHRICQTMKFINEYDGEWEDEPNVNLNKIYKRLLTNLYVKDAVNFGSCEYER